MYIGVIFQIIPRRHFSMKNENLMQFHSLTSVDLLIIIQFTFATRNKRLLYLIVYTEPVHVKKVVIIWANRKGSDEPANLMQPRRSDAAECLLT